MEPEGRRTGMRQDSVSPIPFLECTHTDPDSKTDRRVTDTQKLAQ